MSKSTNQQRETLSVTYVWMSVAFCVCLVVSNIFIPRLWQVGSLPVQLTGAVLLFPISYILNDCLTEVYGYRKARLTIWIGFAMCLFVSVASFIVTKLPKPLYEDSYAAAESFNSLFGLVPRSMIGSLLAFVAGSTVNAWIMSRMKVGLRLEGHHLHHRRRGHGLPDLLPDRVRRTAAPRRGHQSDAYAGCRQDPLRDHHPPGHILGGKTGKGARGNRHIRPRHFVQSI